jgi:hypothetical protein
LLAIRTSGGFIKCDGWTVRIDDILGTEFLPDFLVEDFCGAEVPLILIL